MEFLKHLVELEKVLGESGSVDNIDEEKWRIEVMKVISNVSKQIAIELQQESKTIWDKNLYQQNFDEAPPTRILAITLFLSAWLGWIMNEKHKQGTLTPIDCFIRIGEAIIYGKTISEKYPNRPLKEIYDSNQFIR